MGVTAADTPKGADRSSVFITDALAQRRPKRRDCRREKRDILKLTGCLADPSAEILPQFVDLAMQMTRAVSAGLSVYDADTDPEVFRWKYLRGTLARFEGATTPRDDSPCGVALDRDGPVLIAYPERIYDWIAAEKMVLPEILLVPLAIGRDEPLGTLWVVADKVGHFDRGDAKALSELAEFVGTALLVLKCQEQARQALEDQETVAKEMSHRLKNLFAVTDGMLHASAKSAETPGELAVALSGRLHALASAHSMVRRKVSDIGLAGGTTDLHSLISAVVAAHGLDEERESSPFLIEGPPIDCGDRASNGLALIVHELATNAAKYGALKADGGRVLIRWHPEGDKLMLTWSETGGPPIATTPDRVGFGSTLIVRTIKGQFRGTVERDWQSEGLSVTMTLSLARMIA